VALVVLGRDNWLFRPSALEEFYALGFSEVVCVETVPLRYDAAPLLERLPGVRILVTNQPCTPGQGINLAAAELHSPKFLVLWDDQRLPEAGLHTKVQKHWAEFAGLLLVPELRDAAGREIPGVMVPTLDGSHLKILALPAEEEGVGTLFGQDYTGLYDREAFLRTGGFDADIGESYWQKLDWGFRCHLWGEDLLASRVFRVELRSPWPTEDQSARAGSLRFYLKNLAIRFAGDHAVLPWNRLFRYWRRSGSTLWACLAEFRQIRRWVAESRYRFRADARLLVERWGAEP
jgi:hypothetical protein